MAIFEEFYQVIMVNFIDLIYIGVAFRRIQGPLINDTLPNYSESN